MNHRAGRWALLVACAALAGCATLPSGPSVLVLPGTGKTFDQFQTDNAVCRQYAHAQVGGTTAAQASTSSTFKSAGLGALLGGALGAAAGEGRGAAIGAASGALFGTAVGSSAGYGAAGSLQQRYDYAYEQCMYARGNKIPVAGHFEEAQPQRNYPPPPPSRSQPPPGSG